MSRQMSHLRCPRSSCESFRKRLYMEIGQDETHGDLTVEHRCLSCGYSEAGPRNPTVASKTSDTVRRHLTPLRELLRRQRLEGVEIPMRRYDDETHDPEPIPITPGMFGDPVIVKTLPYERSSDG